MVNPIKNTYFNMPQVSAEPSMFQNFQENIFTAVRFLQEVIPAIPAHPGKCGDFDSEFAQGREFRIHFGPGGEDFGILFS